jgi:hypothetical protein
MIAARRTVVVLVALALAAAAPTPALAQGSGGLSGDLCVTDSECLSRTCATDVCTATTCGLANTSGGVGPTMPAGYCSELQVYNPSRVCAFGYGKCTRAECCDTLSCSEGVANSAKTGYCPAGQTFAGTRLCPGGVCSPTACCIQTKCDGAGGVAVTARATYCPAGQIFNNGGVCAAGPGLCTTSDCCMLDVRTCGAAYTSASPPPACPTGSVVSISRLFDPTATDGGRGGCCETTTCATGVADADRTNYCSGFTKTTFSGTSVCATGTCTQSDCCQLAKGACDGNAVKSGSTCTCPADRQNIGPNKYYLIGTGCVCVPGMYRDPVSGNCLPCAHGFYSVGAKEQTCTQCPSEEPYTEFTGTASADLCINYCDRELNSEGSGSSGACSNGGTCTSLSGGASGSFSCLCSSAGSHGWQAYVDAPKGKTSNNNCDAPTTLLRLRALAASDVELPAGLQLRVNDMTKTATPAYAVQAPAALTCAIQGTATPTLPSCTAGALSGTSALPYLGTMVKLSTNYAGSEYLVEWVCSDGVSGSAATLDVVLPGPTPDNPNAQTTVCTAIFRRPDTGVAVRLALSPNSLTPVAATASAPAQLTFMQGTSGAPCAMDASAVAAASLGGGVLLNCPQAGYVSGSPGTLGVSNIDMERYTVAWTCAGTGVTTSPAGVATTPNLPAAGTPALVCAANFQLKATQVALTVLSTADVPVKVMAKQVGMNEACVATIPANAAIAAAASLECPVGNLASGVATTLETDADLTQYLVSFSCTPGSSSPPTASTAVRTITVESTRNGGALTTCTVSITALPALLEVKVVGAATAGAPSFDVWASQDESDTCVIGSGGANFVGCLLEEGMMPGVTTTLSPRALDANKYELKWSCSGMAAGSFAQADFDNSATVVLNANPNRGGGVVTCTGTVTSRTPPVELQLVASSPEVQTALVSAGAEVRARQSHQSRPCKAVAPFGNGAAPVCDGEGLDAKNKRTTLTTGSISLLTYQVSWACVRKTAGGGAGTAVSVTTVAAGVVHAPTQGDGTTLSCTTTVSPKSALLTLEATGTGPSDVAEWRMTARQATQGRTCTVPVTSAAGTAAAAPSCGDQPPLVPTRSTVLSTSGLDASRWLVTWACTNSGAAVNLADVVSSSGALVPNAKTVVLPRDANVGGTTTACVATVSARADVLLLKATGVLPGSGWTLTAKQPTQASACAVLPSGATATDGAAPTCPSGTSALMAGAAVELSATGLPPSSTVEWSCVQQGGGPGTASVGVAQSPNSGAASLVTPPAPAVTTCTATVTAPQAAPLRLVGSSGATFTASQEQQATPLCSTSSSSPAAVICAAALPETATMLRADDLADGARVRFSCEVGGKNAPVARTSPTTAVVMSAPVTESMTCTVTVLGKPPILVLQGNVATTFKVEVEGGGGAVCTSGTTAANTLSCDEGEGANQLPAEARVVLSQAGLTTAGYYRWSCSSSGADIARGVTTGADATATITLPKAGKSLTCALVYSQEAPAHGRVRRLLMMI